MRRSSSGAGAGASDVDDASAVTVTPAPDAPGVEAQVRVTCPDKTGLAADIARTLFDFGLVTVKGDFATDGKWAFVLVTVKKLSGTHAPGGGGGG